MNTVKINNITQITLEDGSRNYICTENKEYISVTTLLSKYENRANLNAWMSRVGEEEATRIRDTTAARGTEAHLHIENFYGFDTSIIEEYNSHAKTAIEGFYSKVKPVSLEEVVFYEHSSGAKIAGRYDQLVTLPSNTFRYKDSEDYVRAGNIIVDLKTKDKQPRLDRVDYIFRNLLQIATYAYILNLSGEQEVTGACICYAVVLKTKSLCRLIYLNKDDVLFYWDCVKKLLLDYFKVKSSGLSWVDMITLASYDYDSDQDIFLDHLPREIVYVPDTRLPTET